MSAALRDTADPAAIAGTTLDRMAQAWNAGDGAAYGALFADESDFVDIRGGHHRGPAAIGGGHQAIFDSIYAGSAVSYRLDVARELAPGLIMAVATSTLDAPHGPLQGVNHSRLTMVITAEGVTAFHNTLVAG